MTRPTESATQRTDLEAGEILDFAPDAIIGVGRDGAIALANSQAEALFGYARDELIGEPLEILVPERFRGAHERQMEGYFRGPRTRPMGAGFDLRGRRKDGSEFACEISLAPTGRDEGPVAFAAVRDVTERRLIEDELRRTNEELERAAGAKDRFLAQMSHELRAPLNSILGFTGTLLMELPGPLNAAQREQLETVQASGKHLLSLIDDLLDVARIQAERIAIEPEEVDLGALVADLVAGLRPLADANGIAFEVIGPDPGLTLRTDRRALSQILINLLNNALKFTDEGRVSLEIVHERDAGGEITRFRVADTGPGVPPEERERIFGAFEQGPLSPSPRGGTGLGLYISRNLARLLGGELTLESVPGEGSAFTLELR